MFYSENTIKLNPSKTPNDLNIIAEELSGRGWKLLVAGYTPLVLTDSAPEVEGELPMSSHIQLTTSPSLLKHPVL